MIGLVSVVLFLCEKQVNEDGDPIGTCSLGQESEAESSGGFEERLHEVMEKIFNSELYDKVMHSELMDKYADLYEKVVNSDIVDKFMHSRMIKDPKAFVIKVLHELKVLQGELRESFLLHVERRSLIVAGVLVAVAAALMLLGCVWINWCHEEHGEYRYIPVSQVEEFLRYQSIPGAPRPPKEGVPSASRPHRRHRRQRHKGSHAGKEDLPASDPVGLETASPPASELTVDNKVQQDHSADVEETLLKAQSHEAEVIEAQSNKAEDVGRCLAQSEDNSSTVMSYETSNSEDKGVKDEAVVAGEDQDGFVMTHRKHHRQLSNGCSGGKY